MNLYITKGGQQSGPYSEGEVRQLLESGDLATSNLAWVEGSADWLPISEIIPDRAGMDQSSSAGEDASMPSASAKPKAQTEPDHEMSGDSVGAKFTPVKARVIQPGLVPPPTTGLSGSVVPIPDSSVRSKRWIAGILAILLGWAGLHKFFLGYYKEGTISLILGVGSCGFFWIVAFIEGVIFLTMSDATFAQTYLVGRKGWF